MKNYLKIASVFAISLFATSFADAQSVPFNAYSVQSLGGNCVQQGSVMVQSANGQSICLGAGAAGQVLQSGGPGADVSWLTTAGTGTVTSVGLTAPSEISISGSPITAAGSFSLSWANQSANSVFAGPVSGVANTPGFRALVGADLPDPTISTKGGVISSAGGTNQFATGVNTSGAVTYAQPAFWNLSGNIAISQMSGGAGATSSTYWRGDGAWSSLPASASVQSIAALQALTPANGDYNTLDVAWRGGVFVFDSANHAADVAADTAQGIYIAPNSDLTGASGAWVRQYTGIANVQWFGAIPNDGLDDTTALNATTALLNSAFIPNGSYNTNGPWNLESQAVLWFESVDASITSTSATAVLRGAGTTAYRTYFIKIHSGSIYGNSSQTCLDFTSTTLATVYDTLFTQCYIGIKNGGAGSLGAYYNSFYNVAVTSSNTGIENGTLGNEIKFNGGKVGDVVNGSVDYDNSGVVYQGVAFEVFTGAAQTFSSGGLVSSHIRSIDCRFENPSTGGLYATAIAFSINASNADAQIRGPQIIQVAIPYSGSGIRTIINGVQHVTVTQSVASLAAGAYRQDAFTIPNLLVGDVVSVSLPGSVWPNGLIVGSPIVTFGVVYLQLFNATAGALAVASADYEFTVSKKNPE